jgi:hypothetical protein
MKTTCFASWATVLLLASAGTSVAAPQSSELAVLKPHLFGASHGILIVNDQGVEYRTPDTNDARRWTYEQIKQVQVLTPTRLALRTYEDQGWTHLWADRTITFVVEKGGPVTPEFMAALLASTSRPVATAVLPPAAGTLRYQVPVKQVRGQESEGILLLYENALVYQSARKGASRYWRFGDLESVFAVDRFRLEVLTYEGGGGDARPFSFQLKTDLPPGFYDTLWAFLNPPAPLRHSTGR